MKKNYCCGGSPHEKKDRTIKSRRTSLRFIMTLLAVFSLGGLLNAQFTLNTTIGSTGYNGANSGGSGLAVTFVIENTSTQSVLLTDVGDWTSSTDNGQTFSLYYSSSSLSGTPPTAYPAAGWTLAGQNTVSSISSSTLGVNTVISNINLIIPSNTSFRFALHTTGTRRYSGSGPGSCTPNTFSNSGVNLYVGDYQINGSYVGYGASNSPRFFTGSVSFVPATPCSGKPTAGTASGPLNTVCASSPFSLNLTGFTLASGINYQWQSKLASGSVWSDITGATSPSSNQSNGVTVATNYRAIVTCSGSSQSDTSNIVSVTVAPLFPGGTYTINPSLATGGSNFQTLAAAVNAISCGISGPIIFNMAAGNTFNEQVTLPSTIGTSVTKTVTFNGNGDTVNFTGSATMPWTIGLDGADYITFNNLVVKGNGTYSLVTHLWNDADHNNFKKCTFIAPENGSSSTQIPFSVSGSSTSGTITGNSGSYNVVDSCNIINGYYNTVFYGNSAIPNVGNQVKNSLLSDFYIYGSYNLYQSNLLIKNNTIERPTRTILSTFYGIYCTSGISSSTIEQNRIGNQFGGNPTYSGTSYNIYLNSTSTSVGNENKIINNVIGNINGNGSVNAIYLPSAIYTQVYFNTISLDNIAATTGTVYGIYSTGTSGGIDIKNNNISITQGGTGTKYALYFSSSALGKTSNYNNIYIGSTTGTNNVGYLSSAQATFAAWQAAGGGVFDQNSTNVDPLFVSPATGNFTPTNPAMNNLGTPIAGITTDILGNTRSLTAPDMGAYEFNISGCTSPPIPGAAQVSAPTVCTGQSVDLDLTGNSYGLGQTYQWKSGPSATGPWTNIGTPQTTPSLTNVIPAGGATTYYAVDVTCGTSTATSTVDSVVVPAAFAAGTYTINPALPASGTNFQTMAAAVNAMNCGIAGPIIFNMAAGNTFNEQVTLPETIGATATKTVTFNGNGDTVNFTGTATMPWTIGLDGADYITFNNLVVQGNGTYSLVTHLWNDADHNNFKNCTFIAPENGSSSTQIPFSVSGSPTSGTTSGNSGSYNVVDSCTMISGYYNTVFYGNSGMPNVGNQVKNSHLLDYYLYGSHNYYQDDLLVKNNTIERPTRTTLSSFYGIYFSTGVVNSTMEQNRIGNQFGGNPTYSGTSYNIYVSSTAATIGNENKVINNVIGNFNGNSSAYGIYMPSAIYTQVYYNTISIDNTTATSGTVYGIYSTGSTGGIDIKNNNISITQGGSGTKYVLYFSSALGKTSNYNNLYIGSTSGINNIGYVGGAQATFAAWQAANGGTFDQNSTSVDPMFVSPATGDYTPTNALMNNLGTPIAGITTDFLGNTRSTTTPDMGAYEFSVSACTGTVTAGVANAPLTICAGNPLVLDAVGATASAAGLNGNWQSAPSPTGPWADIAGALAPNYTLGAGITAATSFRYWMTCSNNNATDTSNVVTVALNPANQCYCIPTYTYGCGSGDNINNVILTGDMAPGINNLNTPCPASGYQDYTNQSATLTAGFTYNGNVTTTYGSASENVRIWIDYNADGTFQPSEEIDTISSISNTSTGAFSFTVPATQAAGSYRMRVRLVYGGTPATIDPCSNDSYGEAHDYTVNIIASTSCSGTPSAGTIPASVGVCPSVPFDLVSTGSTLAGNITNQWQSRNPAVTGTWTNITGANSGTYTITAGITTATDYRYITKCITSGLSDTSSIMTTTINPANQCYCTPSYTYGCNSGDNIKDVILAGDVAPGINNLNTPCPTNGYQDYTNLSATLTAGNTYSGNVTTSYTSASENVRIWIDYNQNGQFEAGETIGLLADMNNFSTGAYTFTVPAATAAGIYRLRVRLVYSAVPNTIDPCSLESWGETHDYTVVITSGAGCINPIVNLGNDTTICAGNTLTLDAGNAGASYLWNNNSTNQTLLVNTTGTYFVKVSNGACSKTDTIQVTFQPLPVVNLGNDTIICAGSSLTLNADNAGASYLWNNNSTSQTLLVNTTGTYFVKVSNGACSKTDTIQVTFQPLPVVNLGNDTIICAGSSLTLNAGNAGASYLWNNNSTSQTLAVNTTGTYSVKVSIGACFKRDTIQVTVQPLPVVNLGNDTTICSGSSLTLNAGNTGASYLWNNNSTSQTLAVNTTGTYSVKVSNGACFKRDTIQVIVQPLPVVNLGNDTAICAGSSLTLDAGNQGAAFLWNDNSTNQTLDVLAAGTYSVTVTDGGCSASDTIIVSYQELPTGDSIIVDITAVPCTFTFNIANDANTTAYSWNFGDGSANSTDAMPTHQYAANSSYLVTVIISNDCGDSDTLTTTVTCTGVGIGDVDPAGNALILYPNPTSDRITIENSSNLKMEYITVFNVLGQVVYQNTPQSAQKHQLNVAHLASGLYTVRIKTNEGMMIRKFEILK